MISVSLDVMHSRPGIYLVVSPAGLIFVETDAVGACHQLRPDTFERDGEMTPGRWNLPAIGGIFGPLARPCATPDKEIGLLLRDVSQGLGNRTAPDYFVTVAAWLHKKVLR